MKQNSLLPPNDWRMAEVWNASLSGRPERPAQERARVWASELGKPAIDIFLKMRGVEPTNPPNDRSKRKFAAGRLFEFIVELILNRGGILKETQEWVGFQYPGLLEVSGKLDFQAGGIPDYSQWEQFEDLMKQLGFPEEWHEVSQALRDHFANKYPSGLADTILEIKSCSSFMMDSMERSHQASGNHRLQNFHYLKAKNHPLGRIVYICRDDLRMLEIPVLLNDEKIEEEYRSLIETYSKFYEDNKKLKIDSFLVKPDSSDVIKWEWNPAGIEELPKLENPIVWDKDLLKFARNWGIEYSSFLSMLYGYNTQKEFEDVVLPIVSRWNRVLGRIKDGAKMTEKNLEVIQEMTSSGFDPQELAKNYKDDDEETI